MRTYRRVVGLMAISVTTVVHAVTYTWDGGGADNNWSNITNWNPDTAAPLSASNTTVRLDGIIRTTPVQNVATPFVLNGLDFFNNPGDTPSGKAAFTLSGAALQFVSNGATQPRITNPRQATSTIGNAIEIPTGTTLLMDIGTWGLTFTGVISGGGSIDKLQGAGGMNLNNGANSFSGGLTVRALNDDWYRVSVFASGAMGTGPVSLYGGTMVTNKTSPGGLLFFSSTSHTNAITLFQNSPIYAGDPYGTASVTLSGNINLNATNTLFLRGGGTGTLSGSLSNSGAGALTKIDPGTWTLSGANTFTGRLAVVNGTLKFGAANALNPAVPVSLSGGTLDLNGYSQSISQLRNDTVTGGTYVVTSAAAATLTVNQTENTLFDGRLTGALSLVKAGAGSLTLSNSLSTTTGSITVSNGTLVAAATSSLGTGTNVAVAGGTLDLRAASMISDTATLSIADGGAQVKLSAGLLEMVNKLYLGGVQQANGSWGATGSGASHIDDAHFTGGGKIFVVTGAPITAVTATWDAGGFDTMVSTTNNWEGDVLPAFNGATYAIFGTGGSTATVDTAVSLYGMTFNATTNFTVTAGAGSVNNGAGGITAATPSAVSRTYTVAEDLVLTDHQIWNVTNNGAGVTTLNVSGRIDGNLYPYNLTRSGNGVLVLSGNNTYNGTTTVKTGSVVRITSGTAFGSTTGTTTVEDGGIIEMSGGINVTESIALYGDASTSYQGVLRVNGGSNIVSGLILNGSRILCNSGSLDLIGGAAGGQLVLGANGSSFIRVAEKPINIGGSTFFAHTGALIILDVTNNVWGQLEVSGHILRTDKANALAPAGILTLGSSGLCGVNLNGNNQTVGRLDCTAVTAGNRVIYSAAPATLTVNQSANSTFNGAITGLVSFVKAGSYSLTLSNTNTTYGGFTVSNGTLTVSSTGTLGVNSTNIAVIGSGTLSLSNSTAIADSATVVMPETGTNTAKIFLASGVNETVGWLYYGSKMRRAGTYGSTNSTAFYQDSTHFSGSGRLTVLHDNSGAAISLR